ncbi:MAG TPA: primosomal protein N' [Gemmatimonadaceae bacterium]|nr:primosomal protein N' [Gemmatimonadaceae bacterium]
MTPPPPTPPRCIEVALPLPLFHTFTYAVGDASANGIAPGTRVVVPVRNRRAIGICLGPSDGDGHHEPRAVLDVPDAEPALSEPLLALCRWIAQYYVVPLGLVVRCALPALLTGAAAPRPSHKTQRIAMLLRELPSLQERDRLFARARRQRELYEVLEGMGGRGTVAHLTGQLGFSAGVLKGLRERGLLAVEREVVLRDPFAARRSGAPAAYQPTPAQRTAIDALTSAADGDVFLLHGITGSGKTLVYIELLREVVERRGQSAIVLVPEIALTPQTVDRFRAVFGDRVAVLHSALSDGERYDAWLALKRGEKRIAVGARSAIFAPLPNLGAIVVDEEHEGSYKNGETPRYHAREVAVVRARLEGAVVVLGSATPSLESWRNAERGKYTLLSLPERAGAGRLPGVQVVDMRATPRDAVPSRDERRADVPVDLFRRVVSEPLEQALRDRLARGEQSILLLNRRGYASFVQCEACGDVPSCPNCSISLTYHRSPERLVCHYCLHEEPPARACVRCGGMTVRQRGLGTQQVERLLAERFPAAHIARMDVDTTSGKWAHAEILDRVGRGEVEILLGTQMIAKGLDFPNVTLVGVIDADVGINLPDFRAPERSFQLLSQVAGRAGRGPKGGAVFIQTRAPSHHAVQCAMTHDYLAFVRAELPSRAQPAYPPWVRLVNIVCSGTTEDGVAKLAIDAADWIRALLAAHPVAGVAVVGPAPCPIDRIKRRWRWHVLLKAEQAAGLTRVARYFLERFEVPSRGELRIALDRDPVALL